MHAWLSTRDWFMLSATRDPEYVQRADAELVGYANRNGYYVEQAAYSSPRGWRRAVLTRDERTDDGLDVVTYRVWYDGTRWKRT